MTKRLHADRSEFKILVVDDADVVREAVEGFLKRGGFSAEGAESPVDLLYKLHEGGFAAVLLDIDLGDETTCEEVWRLSAQLFSQASLPPWEDLGLSAESPVSGLDLLPIIKAISPTTEVLMLTGGPIREEDEEFLRRHGSYVTVQKLAPDEGFSQPDRVKGLDDELYKFLDELLVAAPAPALDEEAAKSLLLPVDAGREIPVDAEALAPKGESSTALLPAVGPVPPDGTSLTLAGALWDLLQVELPQSQRDWPTEGVGAEVFYYNAETCTLEQIAQLNFPGKREALRVGALPTDSFDGEGICAYAARMRETVQVPDVRFDRRYKQALQQSEHQTVSELAVPLVLGGRLFGVLNLESDTPGTFGNRAVKQVEMRAPMLALLIDYETYRIEEEFMSRMSDRLAGLVHEEAIFSEVLHAALDLAGEGAMGCVLIPDREIEPRRLRVATNHGLELVGNEERPIEHFGVIRRALFDLSGMQYWSRGEHGLEDYVPLAPGVLSEFVTVVRASGRVLAVVDVESSRPALSERHRRLIRRCAELAGSLIDRLRLRGKEEREKALKLALRGVGYAAHLSKGMLGLLRGNLKKEATLSHESETYYRAILQRLEESENLIESFQKPSGPLSLREIVAWVESRAEELALPLAVSGNLNATVVGNLIGFGWMFENLLSNSKRHAATEKEQTAAFLTVQLDGRQGRLTYWDNGRDPAAVSRFVSSQTKGYKHIRALCQLYGWQVEHNGGAGGELRFEFVFPCRETSGQREELA